MTERAARFRDVFAVAEFRALWIAQAQSRVGDQLARVALALLVFERTSSAGLTALMYALTLLPPLLTAPLLAGLADRYSRRTVMVTIELLRAALIALMAIPALPLPVVAVLLLAATAPQPLFAAARNATLPNVLPGDRFPVGMSVVSSTDGLAQVVGFTAGGAIVAFFGSPHLALALDAVTFLLSAALLRWGVRRHLPPRVPTSAAPGRSGTFALAGFRLLAMDRRLLGLASLIWLYGCFLAPEALAAPYAHQIGAGELAVGVLMAANVVGAVIGTLVVTRIRPKLRVRLTVPLAVATGIPLLATVAGVGLPLTVALWAASGLLSSYMVLAQVSFTQQVPDHLRGRAIGIASAGLQTAQGLGVLVAGGLAELMPSSVAIAVCAFAGSLGAVAIGISCRLHTDLAAPSAAATPDSATPDDVTEYAEANLAPVPRTAGTPQPTPATGQPMKHV